MDQTCDRAICRLHQRLELWCLGIADGVAIGDHHSDEYQLRARQRRIVDGREPHRDHSA